MNDKYDLSKFISRSTIDSIRLNLVNREIERRKELKLTQKKLAERSGVSYASIRRFENSGEISLTSLLKIADILGCLEDFKEIFSSEIVTNLRDL